LDALDAHKVIPPKGNDESDSEESTTEGAVLTDGLKEAPSLSPSSAMSSSRPASETSMAGDIAHPTGESAHKERTEAEETRKIREARSEANKRLLEVARANEARRRANVSAREQANSILEGERAAITEIQRIRETIDRGCDFLSSDQEARIRGAATGIIHEAPEAYIFIADCRAKQLCQENPSMEMTLLVTTIEEIVQSLVRELVKTRSRYDAKPSDQESLSRESINPTSVNMSVDHSTSSNGTPSLRHSRSSNRQNFQRYQPEDAKPGPVQQGVVNCLASISNQMLRMLVRSGKNGGWHYFDGTFAGYPAVKRRWQGYYETS
jgi:hypothetical protein